MMDFKQKNPKILVIGDLMIDHYLWGSCERISPEAPVQVISVDRESTMLGGAGNVINNLKALGAEVDVISVVSECNTSEELKDLLRSIMVDTKHLITQKDRVTSKKSRIIAANQQVIRYDRESTDEINNKSQIAILKIFKTIVSNYDVILLSDYGKGLLTFDLRFEKAQKNAENLADALATHPKIARVLYPMRKDHPDHELAKKHFKGNGCNMVSFELTNKTRAAANLFTQCLEGIAFAPTLGDVGTTLSHPVSSSHRSMEALDRERNGISEGFFRVSVGLETPEDLILAFKKALDQM